MASSSSSASSASSSSGAVSAVSTGSTVTTASTTASKKYSLKTHIKKKFVDNFNHVISKPSLIDLQLIDKADKVTFKFNNKTGGAFIDLPADKEYYNDYYRSFGNPFIYGLYNRDNINNVDQIIGALTLVYRYDHKIWQIMDLKIKKEFRGQSGVGTFVKATLGQRIMKSGAYYAICMNTNKIVDRVVSKTLLPKLKDRGKMEIYLVTLENLNKILTTLSIFYCSEIGFVDNNKSRIFVNSSNNQPYKILHLCHNADYRQYDLHEPQRGYQYCFSIHESNEYIITELKDKFHINPSATATVFSNNFKADWSRFVKTFEI